MSYPVPSMKELKNQLERAEFDLARADMIDSPSKRDREMLRYRTQIARILNQMTEISEVANG